MFAFSSQVTSQEARNSQQIVQGRQEVQKLHPVLHPHLHLAHRPSLSARLRRPWLPWPTPDRTRVGSVEEARSLMGRPAGDTIASARIPLRMSVQRHWPVAGADGRKEWGSCSWCRCAARP